MLHRILRRAPFILRRFSLLFSSSLPALPLAPRPPPPAEGRAEAINANATRVPDHSRHRLGDTPRLPGARRLPDHATERPRLRAGYLSSRDDLPRPDGPVEPAQLQRQRAVHDGGERHLRRPRLAGDDG